MLPERVNNLGEIVLECRNLSVSYFSRKGESAALVDVDLTLRAGESLGLVGESGCGKSTLAMAIMHYLGANGKISGGQVRYKGRNLQDLSPREMQNLRGNEISMVYQEPTSSLNPSMAIKRQLIEVFDSHNLDIGAAQAYERILSMLADVNIQDPERVLSAYPYQLSGGQQQRIVIAMALLTNPSLLILDEPTTGLDVTVEAGIVELIGAIAERFSTAVIFISHNLGLVLETCDQVSVMYSGQIVEHGSITSVFTNASHPYTKGLFRCIPVPGVDKNTRPLIPIRGYLPFPHERPNGCYFGPRCDYFSAAICGTKKISLVPVTERTEHLVRCERQDQIVELQRPPAKANKASGSFGKSMLSVENLRKYYRHHQEGFWSIFSETKKKFIRANESVSLDVRESETVAIVGESGCGKSTLARMIVGLETPTDGVLVFEGNDLSKLPAEKRSSEQLKNIQMIFQNPFDTLNPSYRIGTQLERTVSLFNSGQGRSELRKRVYQLLDLVNLPHEYADYRPRQLSGGQKQRIGIARAFAGNPKMVVADEPVSSLDVSVAAAIIEVLLKIQKKYHTSLVFISHDLALVRYLADRIVVMYLGRIVESGTADRIFSPPYHPYTEALLSAVPIADIRVKKERIILEGKLPSVIEEIVGCPFHSRCHRKVGRICVTDKPPTVEFSAGHAISCHIQRDVLERMEPVIAGNTT
jgi:peptide/nickel transport system ATP-binding protein